MKDIDKIVTVTDAKRDLLSLVKEVGEYQEVFAITRKGLPAAVLISMDDYEGLLETLEILSDPKAMKSITKSLRQLDKGHTLSHEEVWG